nr:hypothetical protein [Tanacetum cinerariifolium]
LELMLFKTLRKCTKGLLLLVEELVLLVHINGEDLEQDCFSQGYWLWRNSNVKDVDATTKIVKKKPLLEDKPKNLM